MTKTTDNATRDDDRAFEQLLGRAGPRPVPTAEAVQRVRGEVRAEWQAVTQRHARRRQMSWLAAAATLTAGLSIAWFVWLAPVAEPVQVATIERSIGTIFLAGERSQLTDATGVDVVLSGQTIVTGDEGRVGLAWGKGGSLRLDENTRVTLLSRDALQLARGRVYFDSESNDVPTATLTISTPHGDVTHVGTQYMTEVADEQLIVSVREGRVAIDGRYHDGVASAGKQLRLSGRRAPIELDFSAFGEDWHWVEAAAPAPKLGGRNLRELIEWVSRETGLKVRFADDEVAAIVEDSKTARGSLGDSPRDALKISLLANNLDYQTTESGEIVISQAGQ